MSALPLNPRTLYVAQPEPMPVAAGVLAVAIHIVFAAVLLVNMSWQHKIPPQASVKLWKSMPTTTATARPTRKTKATKSTSAKPPIRPEFKPVAHQTMNVITQAESAPHNPPPRVNIAPEQKRIIVPALERPAPALSAPAIASPSTPRIEVAQPLAPPNPLPRADIAAPKHKRIDMPALERPTLNEPTTAPPPGAEQHPAAAQVAPPLADIVEPERKRIDRQTPLRSETVFAEPHRTDKPKTIEAQAAPKPQVDVDALRRERALVLAENLREEENARLDQSLDRERAARSAELQQRTAAQERKLAEKLKQISDAAKKRRAELEARQTQDAAARAISDDYRARISAKIRQRVILPPDLRGNPEAIYEVSLLPGGEVTTIQLLQSSGVPTYDAAVERAVLAAQPLPVPDDSGLFHANFKNFLLNFRPQE